MKITVTQEIIDGAVQRNSQHCMIADAIKDKTGGKFLLVDLQSIRWSDLESGERYTYLTPPIAQQAIIAFDQGKPIDPFTFRLSTPVRVRPVRRVWTGDPEVVKRARATYERKHRGRKRAKPAGIPSREREFGVRMLQA